METNFTSDEGLEKALEAVRRGGSKVLVWVSIPCTGGSIVQYSKAHHPGARRRMAKRFALFRKLWTNACVVMEERFKAGGGGMQP